MVSTVLILAAGWGELVVLIVFMLISALGQLLSSKPKPKPAPQRQPGPPRGPGQQPLPKPKSLEAELRSEVDDFLRQMRGDPPRKTEPVQPKPVAVKLEPQVVQPKEKEKPKRLVEARPALRHETVQEHVTRQISTADISRHTTHLGEEVGHADERLQAHLREKFQHQVGKLTHQTDRPLEKIKPTPAEELVRLLGSPQGMKQVILANEILRRPEL